jgi:hypothetical protein
MKKLALAVTLALGACTAAQQTAGILLAAEALPCYEAVVAATGSGSAAVKVLTAADVAATNAACLQLDAATQSLIASAVNTKTPVTVAPAS